MFKVLGIAIIAYIVYAFTSYENEMVGKYKCKTMFADITITLSDDYKAKYEVMGISKYGNWSDNMDGVDIYLPNLKPYSFNLIKNENSNYTFSNYSKCEKLVDTK